MQQILPINALLKRLNTTKSPHKSSINLSSNIDQNSKIGAQCLSPLHQKAHLSSLSFKKITSKICYIKNTKKNNINTLSSWQNMYTWRPYNDKKKNAQKFSKTSIKETSNIPKDYDNRSHWLPPLHHSAFIRKLISLEEPQL